MVHIPTEEIYAVAGVQYMPEYKPGYYRVWTRLSRIPNENIPMTKMVRYGRGHEMPEFDGLLYFNCKWASEQPGFKATFGTGTSLMGLTETNPQTVAWALDQKIIWYGRYRNCSPDEKKNT